MSSCKDPGHSHRHPPARVEHALYSEAKLGVIVAGADGGELVARGNRVTWRSAQDDRVVLLLDDEGRAAELYADGTLYLFGNERGDRMDIVALLSDGSQLIARGVDAPPRNAEDFDESGLTVERAFVRRAAEALSWASCSVSFADNVLRPVSGGAAKASCGSKASQAAGRTAYPPALATSDDLATVAPSCGGVDWLACGTLLADASAEMVSELTRVLADRREAVRAADRALYAEAGASLPALRRPALPLAAAGFALTPNMGRAPLELALDGRASRTTDEAGISQYQWDVQSADDLSIRPKLNDGPLATTTLAEPGRYLVSLRIMTASGASDVATKLVTVLDAADSL